MTSVQTNTSSGSIASAEVPPRGSNHRGRDRHLVGGADVGHAIRQLRHGDPIPNWEPRRYVNDTGYIRLRWRVVQGWYVEAYEHRVVMGLPPEHVHVHHVNYDRQDNRPENLKLLDGAEHARFHALDAKIDVELAAKLYGSGLSTVEVARQVGCDASTVSRRLRQVGVTMRPRKRPAQQVDADVVALLHGEGVAVRYIADHLGVTKSAVQRVKAELGLGPGASGGLPSRHEEHAREVFARLKREGRL